MLPNDRKMTEEAYHQKSNWNIVHQVHAQNSPCHTIVALEPSFPPSQMELFGLQMLNQARCLYKSNHGFPTLYIIRKLTMCLYTSFRSQVRAEYAG